MKNTLWENGAGEGCAQLQDGAREGSWTSGIGTGGQRVWGVGAGGGWEDTLVEAWGRRVNRTSRR